METVSDVLQPKMMVRVIVRSNDTPENYQTIENVQMNSIVYGLTLKHLPTISSVDDILHTCCFCR